MKKVISLLLAVMLVVGSLALVGCSKKDKDDTDWQNKGWDLSVPVLNENGWYMVFEDDFNGTSLNENINFGEKYTGNKEIWTTSPHAIRWESNDKDKPEQACWWCDNMVEVKDGNAIIHSRYEDNHTCDGECPSAGRFTSGIETRIIEGDNNANKGMPINYCLRRLSAILNAESNCQNHRVCGLRFGFSHLICVK